MLREPLVIMYGRKEVLDEEGVLSFGGLLMAKALYGVIKT